MASRRRPLQRIVSLLEHLCHLLDFLTFARVLAHELTRLRLESVDLLGAHTLLASASLLTAASVVDLLLQAQVQVAYTKSCAIVATA